MNETPSPITTPKKLEKSDQQPGSKFKRLIDGVIHSVKGVFGQPTSASESDRDAAGLRVQDPNSTEKNTESDGTPAAKAERMPAIAGSEALKHIQRASDGFRDSTTKFSHMLALVQHFANGDEKRTLRDTLDDLDFIIIGYRDVLQAYGERLKPLLPEQPVDSKNNDPIPEANMAPAVEPRDAESDSEENHLQRKLEHTGEKGIENVGIKLNAVYQSYQDYLDVLIRIQLGAEGPLKTELDSIVKDMKGNQSRFWMAFRLCLGEIVSDLRTGAEKRKYVSW